ncbi:hypothetical protein PYW08_009549 [Mythimna loreyi]|uniref:Uncharacterized protein n=1 Tax=Mythimna loreyi TaxID=667449 RepID=A0ACC2QB66_9NEOP|nr:hypothetical protein PYW08_009549 [Mythimna loreyi]
MKTSLKYFVVVLCLNIIEAAFRCDYKHNVGAKGWFKYHVVPATWFDARLRCALEGAALVSPTTFEIQSEMINIINKSTLKQEIFTGIHASLSQGDYYTVEGTPLSSIPLVWAANEPDNKANKESCITFNRNGELADRPCEDTRPYVCYRPESPIVQANECGTVDQEYHLDTRTNKCYKFHRVARNFSRAAFACSAEGGHLAIVNSNTEATVLSEIFSQIPKNEIMVARPEWWKNVTFIGFHNWGERVEWRTVHGQTLNEAGYNIFYPGEPNGEDTGEFCGCIFRSGLLCNIWCDKEFTFICEKSPSYPGVCHEGIVTSG